MSQNIIATAKFNNALPAPRAVPAPSTLNLVSSALVLFFIGIQDAKYLATKGRQNNVSCTCHTKIDPRVNSNFGGKLFERDSKLAAIAFWVAGIHEKLVFSSSGKLH